MTSKSATGSDHSKSTAKAAGKMVPKAPLEKDAVSVDQPASPESRPVSPTTASVSPQTNNLASSANALTLSKGLYLISVKGSAAVRGTGAARPTLPAVLLSPAPGEAQENLELIPSPDMNGPWLTEVGDAVVLRAKANQTTILLSSVRLPSMTPLQIDIQRLDQLPSRPGASEAPTQVGREHEAPRPAKVGSVRFRLVAHIQNRGDVAFDGASPAGFPGMRLGIEGFAIVPLDTLGADQLEYKTIDAQRRETAWVEGGAFCGSRGKGIPLSGFCIKIKPQADGREFDCIYSGLFASGRAVGPVKNGAPCWSSAAGDFLEAVVIEIVERAVLPRG